MTYHAHCRGCDTRWRVVPPAGLPMDLGAALRVMEAGRCPDCGNDGGQAPVNWRFTFHGDREPTTAQIRAREESA